MGRFMVVTLLFVGWGLFELSGGTDFVAPEPEAKPLQALLEEVQNADTPVVAQAANAPAQARVLSPGRDANADASAAVTLASFGRTQGSLATVLGEAAKIAEPEQVAATPLASVDLRIVNGSRVNMRTGPGTNYQVLSQLLRGEEAEVLSSNDAGWVKIRALSTGRVGWMAERLLTRSN
ncbi:MAG: SH3 domain-containing protein [Pseudomonadota bacterium]